MNDALLAEISFAEHRWLDHAHDSGEIRDALKTVLTALAAFIVAIGTFVWLLNLCRASDFSLWWAGVPYIALYAVSLWRECVLAIPFLLMLSGPVHADGAVSAVVGFVVEAMQDPDNTSYGDDDDGD